MGHLLHLLYMHVGYVCVEFLIQTLTHVHYCYCEAEMRSSCVSVVYVECLCIVFSKAALQKRGSMEPMEATGKLIV